MGDRAEVKIVYGTVPNSNADFPPIYFYTHWGGYRLHTAVQEALFAGKSRWNDDTYLGRIIVSQLIGADWDETTGYGLAPYHMETEYPSLTIHLTKQEVTIDDTTYPFDEYIVLDEATLNALWHLDDDE